MIFDRLEYSRIETQGELLEPVDLDDALKDLQVKIEEADDDTSTKQEAILDLGSPQRAGNLNSPKYDPSGRLGSLLRLAIEGLCTDSTIDRLEAL